MKFIIVKCVVLLYIICLVETSGRLSQSDVEQFLSLLTQEQKLMKQSYNSEKVCYVFYTMALYTYIHSLPVLFIFCVNW